MTLSQIISSYRDAELRKKLARIVEQTRESERINRWRQNRARQLKEPRKSQFLASFGEG